MILTDAAKRAMRGDTSVAPTTVHALAEALLEAGIDVTLVNANRQTALDVVRAINLPHKAPLLAALDAKSRDDSAALDAANTTATNSTASSIARADSSDHDDPPLADKPRKRISLQQHDVSHSVNAADKRRSGHKKGSAIASHADHVEVRARSKSTSIHGERRTAARAASSLALQPTLSIGAEGAKTSDLKRGDRLVPGPTFKLNFAALEIKSTPVTQSNTPTEADRRAQTARVIPSLGNVPVPILRSPREAQPPLTLGLGALISPRALRDHKSSSSSSKKSKKSSENSENETKTSSSLTSSPARKPTGVAPPPPPSAVAAADDASDSSVDRSQDLLNRAVKKLDLSDIPPPLPPLSNAVAGTPPRKQRHHKSRHGQSAPVSPRDKS